MGVTDAKDVLRLKFALRDLFIVEKDGVGRIGATCDHPLPRHLDLAVDPGHIQVVQANVCVLAVTTDENASVVDQGEETSFVRTIDNL
jgi:hypothetical protein